LWDGKYLSRGTLTTLSQKGNVAHDARERHFADDDDILRSVVVRQSAVDNQQIEVKPAMRFMANKASLWFAQAASATA